MLRHARLNGGSSATIHIGDTPYQSGTFKRVWLGHYNDGFRRGERCIVKEFKEGSVYEEYFFEEEIKIVDKAIEITGRFNMVGILGGRKVRVNMPVVATATSREIRGVKVLAEPFIHGFDKFNSNSGWINTAAGDWGEAMQALSHFSYHDSNGRYLLCDLQGGIYQNEIVLTDPIIMSLDGTWGPGDMGAEGIKAFFQLHQCGRFCRSHWNTPGQPRAREYSQQGTKYVLNSRACRSLLPRW